MKHNIRQRVINQYGLPVVKVESVNGELGSGCLDKNGVEIFEGDKVVVEPPDSAKPVTCTVICSDCAFWLVPIDNRRENGHLAALPYCSARIEVVGHVGN